MLYSFKGIFAGFHQNILDYFALIFFLPLISVASYYYI